MNNRLKELRKAKGLSVAALAKELGMNEQTLWTHEGGQRSIPIDTIVKYCDFFKCSIDYFFYRENSKLEEIDDKTLDILIDILKEEKERRDQ